MAGRVDRLALVAGLLVLFVAAPALTRRERTIATTLPTVTVGQVVLHVLMSQAAPGSTAAVSAGDPAAVPMPASHAGSPGLGVLLMRAVAVLVTS
ncbi:hypothetical protein BZB76_0482 [Actinomadura pelletieri DSM 43383]|uniref:Uncharacterized protein n=1 Tax=Actinomadura pelletieri DSM 43383 TaxID=1120940 RepID=A0A495QY32_9ACTN|nr:hypothetical protein [Actinomadura pelletieri]RKS79043.1 hypothetical protein BZB76_0482 [Actinomadura pelletieri DSM 43383]